MTRKKVKLAYITNDSSRKATFKKRKKGLMKKVSELSTLCGIDACAIVYSPYDSQPEVWPSPAGVQRVLSQFRKMPEMEQSKKMVNQESFLRQRIAKANEQLKKQRKDNREKEMIHVMFQSLTGGSLQGLNMMDLNDLDWLIDQNLKEITKASESYDKNVNDTTPQVAPPPAQPPPPPALMSGSIVTNPNSEFDELLVDQKPLTSFGMNMQRQQWPMDMLNCQGQTSTWLPVGEDMNFPFVESQPNAFWSNGFFP